MDSPVEFCFRNVRDDRTGEFADPADRFVERPTGTEAITNNAVDGVIE